MLNFKDWKLSSQDGTKALLTHANGHQMTIAMKALPKIQREQIMRLAKANEFKDGGEVQKFAEKGMVSANNPPVSAQPVEQAPQEPEMNAASAYADDMVSPQAEAPAVTPFSHGAPEGPLNDNGQENPGATAKQMQAGLVGKREVQSALSKAAVPIEQGRLKAESLALDPVQKAYVAMQNEVQGLDKDVQINPNRYMQQMSAPKQALSMFGLILGGLGAGQLGSVDNPAMRMLNSQIDRDIDAQKATFNNKKTVWGAYHDMFGDSATTYNLTHAAMDRVYDHSLRLAAQKIGTPAAWAEYLQKSAELASQTQQHIKEAAVRIPSVPGYNGAAYDTSAAVKHPLQLGPGQQGPASAQAAPQKPLSEREFLDSDDKPISGHSKSITMAGINPNATDDELQEKGIYPKENSRSQQMKDITAHEIPPLLRDDAKSIMDDAQYDIGPQGLDPKAPFANDINEGYKNAKFVDHNLKNMNRLYGQAIDAVEKSGLTGRVKNAGSHVVGALTGALGSLTGHGGAAAAAGSGGAGIIDTAQTRLEENALRGLESVVNASLNGVKGVDAATVHGWVQDAKPVYGDSPNHIKQKFQSLIQRIKDHVNPAHIEHLLRESNG